ncbi:hypothetical protein CMUS01_12856 [Colletotrichum musicola]|uniref:Uncharacterized protein n=1 Tax=Colletotrichum musicola TaxID=2175873 RepID=A0A8H6JHR0_9PEZI|nr:hypothetical protein CMUS01_12856 [Colletotrichum musicola]
MSKGKAKDGVTTDEKPDKKFLLLLSTLGSQSSVSPSDGSMELELSKGKHEVAQRAAVERASEAALGQEEGEAPCDRGAGAASNQQRRPSGTTSWKDGGGVEVESCSGETGEMRPHGDAQTTTTTTTLKEVGSGERQFQGIDSCAKGLGVSVPYGRMTRTGSLSA